MQIGMSVQYKGMDFWLTVIETNEEVELVEYELELDYQFGKPHKFDHIARMVIDMLADGSHLGCKIIDHVLQDKDQYSYIYDQVLEAIALDKQEHVEIYYNHLYDERKEFLRGER